MRINGLGCVVTCPLHLGSPFDRMSSNRRDPQREPELATTALNDVLYLFTSHIMEGSGNPLRASSDCFDAYTCIPPPPASTSCEAWPTSPCLSVLNIRITRQVRFVFSPLVVRAIWYKKITRRAGAESATASRFRCLFVHDSVSVFACWDKPHCLRF